MKDIDTVSILGMRFNSVVFVCDRMKGPEHSKRLRNWYRLDHGLSDMDNFTWGYSGQGPYELAYSMLRELFGREVAGRDTDALCSNLISVLDNERCFDILGAQIRIVLGIGADGEIIRKRSSGTDDRKMTDAGLCIASIAGTLPGGAYEFPAPRIGMREHAENAIAGFLGRIMGIWKRLKRWEHGNA